MAERRGSSEDRLLRRLRLTSGLVTLSMIVLLVFADTFGRLLIDREFHVSEIIFGTLCGSLVAFVGAEALARTSIKKGDSEE